MKKIKTGKLWAVLCSLMACVLVFSLTACGGGEGGETDSLTLSATTAEVEVGKTTTISVTSAETEEIIWSVDKTDVAAVTGSGAGKKLCTVTGVKEGTATITAKAGDKTATCALTVRAVGQGGNPSDEGITIKLNGEAVGTDLIYIHLNEELNFTAETTESGAINWESSNTGVATVDGGKVTAIAAGEAVITAKLSDTVKATVRIKVIAPTSVANGGENEYESGWRYWAGDGNAVISSCVNYAETNETQIKYTWTSGQFYSVQLFYKDKTAGTDHDISLTIVSPVAANITVNGAKQELVEGENKISVKGFTGATLSVQFGVDGENTVFGTDLLFAFKDIVVKSNADAELVAPSFGYDADTKIITITDEANDSANVEKYVLGVFANAEADTPAYTIDVVSGEEVNLSTIPTGQYVLRLRAVNSSTKIINSGWSTQTESLEWSNEKTPLAYGENANIAAGSSTWYYWNQTWDPVCSFTECYMKGNSIYIVGISNNVGNPWSFQLFYKGEAGKKMTMTVNSVQGGTITIGSTEYELEAGVDKEVEIADITAVAIIFGANVTGNTSSNIQGDITFSNIVIE